MQPTMVKANAYPETDAGSCDCPAAVRCSAPGIAAQVPVVLYWAAPDPVIGRYPVAVVVPAAADTPPVAAS